MHDFFDILGLPTDAAPSEVRRACARRSRRTHPDFVEPGALTARGASPGTASRDPVSGDVAIDFIDVRSLVDRMETAFFETGS